jgi:hypothetical protein
MRIFLCYPHEHRRVAEGMRLALEQEGHEVFFDRANLTPGEEYVAAIRRQVEAADLFVFCLSPESVQPGRFVLTELDLAEKKWRRPHQHVLPVLVAPVSVALVPPFLTAVGILEPRGDIPAEVANCVARLSHRLRKRRLARSIGIGLGALGILAVAGLAHVAWRDGWIHQRIAITGTWSILASDAAGDLPSQFLLEVDKTNLSGTVFYGRQVRPILDGIVKGDKITFSTRRSYTHDGQTVDETDRYQGLVSGREIAFLRQVERRDSIISVTRFTVERRTELSSAVTSPARSAIGCSFGEELSRLELREDDVSQDPTVYLICRLRNTGTQLVGREGIAIYEEPFGHERMFTTESIAAMAKELQHRAWACGEDQGNNHLVRRGVGGGGAAPHYVICQQGGKPVSLELRVTPQRSDGSPGLERSVTVKLS